MRGAALLLVLTLVGPSVGSLVCDWMCAVKHEQSNSSGSCHERAATGSTAALGPGHRCHDIHSSTASILTGAPHLELRATPVAAVLPDDGRPSTLAFTAGRSSGTPHAPPPLLKPLRI